MIIINRDQEKYHLLNICNLCRYARFSQAQSHIWTQHRNYVQLLGTSTEKNTRSRTPVFKVGMSTGQTTEPQELSNKQSNKEADPFHHEEHKQQTVWKQQSGGELIKQSTHLSGQIKTAGDRLELQETHTQQEKSNTGFQYML